MRLNQTLGCGMAGKYLLSSLPSTGMSKGFVAVALDEEIGKRLVDEAVAIESLADLDPEVRQERPPRGSTTV